MERTTRLGRAAVGSAVGGALMSGVGNRATALIRSCKRARQARAEMSAEPRTQQAINTMQPVATPAASCSAAKKTELSPSTNGWGTVLASAIVMWLAPVGAAWTWWAAIAPRMTMVRARSVVRRRISTTEALGAVARPGTEGGLTRSMLLYGDDAVSRTPRIGQSWRPVRSWGAQVVQPPRRRCVRCPIAASSSSVTWLSKTA